MGELGRSIKQAGMVCGILGLLVCGSLQLLGRTELSGGLLVGMIGGIGYFGLMWRQLVKNRDAAPEEAVAELQGGWVERALYMGSVCAIAWFIPGIQFAGVLIGLLSIHAAVFIWGVIALSKSLRKKQRGC